MTPAARNSAIPDPLTALVTMTTGWAAARQARSQSASTSFMLAGGGS